MSYKSKIIGIGIITILVSFSVIIGWLLDIPFLQSILPDYHSMKFNTALSFFITGLILLNFAYDYSLKLSYILSIFLILLSLSTFIEYSFSLNLGIDELIVKDKVSRIKGIAYPGRPAASTEVCFLLFGLASLFTQTNNLKKIGQYFYHVISFVSFLAIFAYIYTVPALDSLEFLTTMAVHTSVLFLLISVGGAFYQAELGLMEIFSSKSAGSEMTKRLLPTTWISVIFLGSLINLCQRYELFNVEFSLALFSSSFILISLFLFWDTFRKLNAIDAQKQKIYFDLQNKNTELAAVLEELNASSEELRDQRDRLLNAIEEKDTLFKELHHRIKNNLQMVISLLHIKSSREEAIGGLKSFIMDTRTRIHSIALIHEQLLQMRSLNQLNINDYLIRLSEHLIGFYDDKNQNFNLETHIIDEDMDIDQVMILGFILNEAVSNTIKHAYIAEKGGAIYLSLRKTDSAYEFIVGDKGTGYNSSLLEKEKMSYGLQLIHLFAEQLVGKLEISINNGVEYKLTFPSSL
ncbi:MAG: sensor histidine kinase [Cyclobacteriaceae bacterium]